jgi:hypothetical protein
MRFTPQLVAGVTITLLGTLLLFDRLALIDMQNALRYWPVLLTLFGVSIIVQALRGDRDDGTPGGRTRSTRGFGFVWLFLLVWIFSSGRHDDRFAAAGASGDPELTLVGVMSQDSRTSVATAFRGAQMTSVMGRTRLDLRQATIAQGGEATVNVFGLMGGVEVIVPEAWTIDVQTTSVMGGVRDRRGIEPGTTEEEFRRPRRDRRRDESGTSATPSAPAPAPEGGGTASRLILRGMVVAGGLVIRS